MNSKSGEGDHLMKSLEDLIAEAKSQRRGGGGPGGKHF